mmetsp:Transcript_15138/g.28943  ORF Transcript_15138/g.28943 Transcript_15138/m.28943 type:complete len:98 (-) Transcript_15138:42-335(-)
MPRPLSETPSHVAASEILAAAPYNEFGQRSESQYDSENHVCSTQSSRMSLGTSFGPGRGDIRSGGRQHKKLAKIEKLLYLAVFGAKPYLLKGGLTGF